MAQSKSTLRGRFIPKNAGKYLGDPNKIIFRSSWELHLFKWLDATPAVMQWASEEFSIPYLSPIDNRVHQYFPDALVVYRAKDNSIRKEIVEIKPYKESVLTAKSTDRDKMAYVVNTAKWKAAAIFAEQQGMKFRIITEKTIFANGANRKK